MKIRRSEHVVVQSEPYNQWHHEISVELTHQDYGLTDDQLAALNDDEWEELFSSLKTRAEDEVMADVKSFFKRMLDVSDVENLASRYLNKPANQQTSKSRRR